MSKLDEQLEAIAESDPDRAAELLQALADNDHAQDRTTAAIYTDTLRASRPELTNALLSKLLQDPDEGVRTETFDTLETMVGES